MIGTMGLVSLDEAIAIAASGRPAFFAGDEPLLRRLPAGNWIAGTIPYFMNEHGSEDHERIFVSEQVEAAHSAIGSYAIAEMETLLAERPRHGYTILIIPGLSDVHLRFQDAVSSAERLLETPMVGFASGVALADIGIVSPLVFDGATREGRADRIVALHVTLPAAREATVGIVNPFREKADSVKLVFPNDGFRQTDVLVDGVRHNFAEWIRTHDLDLRSPLIANLHGYRMNVSFRAVSDENHVDFYGPIFAGQEYELAASLDNYEARFASLVAEIGPMTSAFSCNCVVNYVHGDLAGKHVGYPGPMSFGEIAYMLLNQTMVYLKIDAAA